MTVFHVKLRCGHQRGEVRMSQTTAWCSHCRMYKVVQWGWRGKCQQCRFGGKYGEGKLTCITKATTHAIKYHHRVVIWYDTNMKQTREVIDHSHPDGQLMLGDEPPF